MIKLLFAVLFGLLVLPETTAQKVIRGPYLQQPTADGMVIRWRTDVPTSSEVIISSQSSGHSAIFNEHTLTTEHSVAVTGLAAATKYFYSIGEIEKKFKENPDQYIYLSPKDPDPDKPITFWVMGDFGASKTAKYLPNQQEVLQQFKKQKGHADLWIWLGDNSYESGTDAEYQTQIFDFYGSEILGNMPILPTPGNHEYFAGGNIEANKKSRKIPYFDIITTPTQGESGGVPSGQEAYYSVDYGNIHFVSLDSYGYDEGYPLYDKRSKQFQWLEQDLAANKQRWTVVFFHHPPYTKRSHDSDGEKELISMRENLVPVFDKYKVDLVMAGHSHVYERSYLMKNHLGKSFDFNHGQHPVQLTNAFYTADSPPIINKDDGTIYQVIGSAGRLDWNGRPEAHESSVYANYQIGGSSVFTVTDNRLDAEWICADGEIRDRFTVFKNVNKRSDFELTYGDSLTLSASWSGNYRWSDSAVTTRIFTVSPKKNSLITVSDSLGYLQDSFYISVSPQPVLTTVFNTNQNLCQGSFTDVSFNLAHTDFKNWTYRVELSDAAGNFDKPVVLATGKQQNFKVKLPENLISGDAIYQIRIMPNADFFSVKPSQNFKINTRASAEFTTDSPLPFAEQITLKVNVRGTLPADLKITSLENKLIENEQVEFNVNISQPVVFKIEKLTNVCGEGLISNKTVEVLSPLGVEATNETLRIFPNPTHNLLLIEMENIEQEAVGIKIYSAAGKLLRRENVIFDRRYTIRIDKLQAGTYFVELQTKAKQIIRKRFVVQ